MAFTFGAAACFTSTLAASAAYCFLRERIERTRCSGPDDLLRPSAGASVVVASGGVAPAVIVTCLAGMAALERGGVSGARVARGEVRGMQRAPMT